MKFNYTIEQIDRMNCALLNVDYETYKNWDCSQQFNFGKVCFKINVLQNKALKMVPNSPEQLKVRKQIEKLLNTYRNK